MYTDLYMFKNPKVKVNAESLSYLFPASMTLYEVSKDTFFQVDLTFQDK